MVKVLNIISDTNVGGAGRVILNYLKHCDRENFNVSVALPVGSLLKEPLEALNTPVYEIEKMADKSFDFAAIKKIQSLIQNINPDIVHTHGSLSGRIAAKRCGKIVMYTRHSVFPVNPRIKSGLGRMLNKLINEHYADRIIAVSPAAKENLTDGGISEDLIEVIMNGVEAVQKLDEGKRMRLREQYGIENHEFTAGILARIEDYKGHMLILEAAKALQDDGRKIKILIAGTGSYEEEIKKRLQDLALENTVIFLGFVTDVASLLNILDVQLNASYGTEATSLSLLEGMSIGLPAIVSDYGGNPWLIEHRKTGLVFKSRDSAALAKSISLLMDEPALRVFMGACAEETFRNRFTGQIFAKNIENAYVKAMKGAQDGK